MIGRNPQSTSVSKLAFDFMTEIIVDLGGEEFKAVRPDTNNRSYLERLQIQRRI